MPVILTVEVMSLGVLHDKPSLLLSVTRTCTVYLMNT